MALPFPKRRSVPGVLASFEHIDSATDAIRGLRAKGHRDLTVYTSHPNHEVEEAVGHTNSPVRLFTLIGGLTGCTAGFAMTIWMSRDWPLLVGGKTIGSIPPYVVIAFELTILPGPSSPWAAWRCSRWPRPGGRCSTTNASPTTGSVCSCRPEPTVRPS